jgi:hypothetical protein
MLRTKSKQHSPEFPGAEASTFSLFRAGLSSLVVEEALTMAKGIEKGKKENKPKLSTKEKQKKKKEKKAASGA